MNEMRARGREGAAAESRQDQHPLDDWLGDISDEDWNEGAAELAGQRRAPPPRRERRPSARLGGSSAQAQPVGAPEARRAPFERRRAIAALVAVLLVGVGVGAGVLLLRDDAEAPATTVQETTTAPTTDPTETDPVQPTTPTTTTPTTPTEDTATFVLPEGTKLQFGESVGESDLVVSTDPELVADLQRALARAGFDPGTPDGSFGENTEQAVIAFQQANGLTPDGIVGPETAAALNAAAAGG